MKLTQYQKGCKILKLYNSKEYLDFQINVNRKSISQVAEELQCSTATIQNKCTKFGVRRKLDWEVLNEKHGQEIEEMYRQGMFISEIRDRTNYGSDYTITEVLKNRGVTLLTRKEISKIVNTEEKSRIYDLDVDYFKSWSNNMSYILGIIASDGSISSNLRVVEISMSSGESNKKLLNDIKKELGYTGVLRAKTVKANGKEYKAVALTVCSQTIVKDLLALGIEPRKSLSIQMLDKIPYEYRIHFIRGFFDGDGSIEMYYPSNAKKIRTKTPQLRLRICSGSKAMLLDMENHLHKFVGVKRKKVQTERKNYHVFTYSTFESIKIYNAFYKDNGLCLTRKKDIFERCIQKRIDMDVRI